MAPLLEARGVTVSYPGPQRVAFAAVRGVDLTLRGGETLGVVGESGSGKSTLGRAIAGLQPVTGGAITLEGQDITVLSRKEKRRIRSSIQFIFQDPYSALNPSMNVADTIERSLILHTTQVGKARAARLGQLLRDVGLSSQHATRYPAELSGGQRQRVAIARALAVEPRVIVADEPTSALDVSIQAQILNLLRELVAKRGLGLVLITHDFGAVGSVADRVAVMHLGEIVEAGTRRQVIRDPRHPYTQALLSAVPSPRKAAVDRLRLTGRPLSIANPPPGCRLHPRCPFVAPSCRTEVQELRRMDDQRVVRCQFAEMLPAGNCQRSPHPSPGRQGASRGV